nr:immunoglobulin heavy chain junction region [Macaca mulatta]
CAREPLWGGTLNSLDVW